METTSRMLALGSSMFPLVPSGSVLTLRAAAASSVRVGDILAYPARLPGEGGALVAHRVVAVRESAAGWQFTVRGDAQDIEEEVAAADTVFVVARVVRGWLRYRAGGPLGRVLAHIAVQRGAAWRLGCEAARIGVSLKGSVRAARPEADGGRDVVRLATSRPSLPAVVDDTPRDSLLRGLKHELRTPLNAILGFADLLLGELDGPLDGDERENVNVVREAGWNLLELINEVLDLATALIAPDDAVYEDTDCVALLEELRRELEQRSGLRPVHVRVTGSLDHFEPRVERRLLLRVLRALGEVALAVTSAGGITLGVGFGDEPNIRLWLAADGFGTDPDADREDPVSFAIGRARRHDRVRRALSLRMAMADHLLRRHGASLSIAEHEGGHVLSIRVPVSAAQGQPAPAPEPQPDVSLALSYIAAMGHELRTPLNAIMGFAELLVLDSKKPWSGAQRRSLDIVRERAVDLCALIDDMIDWAKLEAGELELTRLEQPVLPLIERAVTSALKRSGTRGLTIALHADPTLGFVSVDGPRCVQAILGLMDHAVRSNPGPAVVIRVQRTAAVVQLELVDPGLEYRPQDQTAVFDAFRPSHAPTGQRISGLQLGPSVARSLLRAHGGDVWFDCRPGHGTVFTATLPRALRSSQVDLRKPPTSGSSGGGQA